MNKDGVECGTLSNAGFVRSLVKRAIERAERARDQYNLHRYLHMLSANRLTHAEIDDLKTYMGES